MHGENIQDVSEYPMKNSKDGGIKFKMAYVFLEFRLWNHAIYSLHSRDFYLR